MGNKLYLLEAFYTLPTLGKKKNLLLTINMGSKKYASLFIIIKIISGPTV
jgi:hypothetical protein